MKQGLRFGGQMLGYYATLAVLCFLFLGMIGGETFWLQVVLNVVLVGALALMMLNAGGYRGEKACTLAATLEKRRAEGKAIDPEQEAQVYDKKVAFIGYATAVLPLLLIATVNLIYAPIHDAKVAALPPLPVVQTQPVEGDGMPDVAPAGENADPGLVPVDVNEPEETPVGTMEYVNWVTFVARIAFMPFVSLITYLSENTQLLNILFLPLSLILPAFGAAGYLTGPRLRQKKLDDIAKGVKRKKRNLRVNQKPRQPKGPKHEV